MRRGPGGSRDGARAPQLQRAPPAGTWGLLPLLLQGWDEGTGVAVWLWQVATNRKRVENIAKKKLDSLMKESKIRDCEDPNDFTVSTLPPSGKLGRKAEGKKVRAVHATRSACGRGKGRGIQPGTPVHTRAYTPTLTKPVAGFWVGRTQSTLGPGG